MEPMKLQSRKRINSAYCPTGDEWRVAQ